MSNTDERDITEIKITVPTLANTLPVLIIKAYKVLEGRKW
jgi:hypothetical protein